MGRTMAVVLFTDLVGSTELRGRLGEEAADELRRKHDQLLAQAVEANSGRVVKGLGDGIMATFAGASDAVAAAVAIQQGINRRNRSGTAPVPLSVRIGLSAGDVALEDDDVHGTPVIEASRLCAAAGGGEILAAEVVRILAGSTGGHDFLPVAPFDLKGLEHPVAAVRIGWEPVAVSMLPMPTLLTDVGRIFVGRDAELERLGRLWKEAAAGERRLALLAGEPGVGKTRLAAELVAQVHEEGGVILTGRCDEDLGVPYQPFVEALRYFVEHVPSSDLKARLGRYGGELLRLEPDLSDRVDLAPPLQSDPETERFRLFDAVAAWLSAVSDEEPLLVVLDDLQWAAKPTLLLLRHVVRTSDARRLLILGTYRDTELTHDHPLVELVADLRRDGLVERLPLSGLDDVAVAAIVELAAGEALDDDGASLARAIYQETEGNPFFVREVLRHLAETNAIGRDGGRWRTRVPIDRLGIPEGVRDVVGRRLSRLSDHANQTLGVAAVVGPEFEVDLVQSAGGFEESELLAALDEAVGARLVREVGPTRFRFSHALVRATLYESLTGARKVALHRKVALAIEAVYEGTLDDHLSALAHHWAFAAAPAAEVAKAVDYAARAGDRALAQLAHDEAVSYYRQALELMGLRDDPERLDLLIALGEAQRRAGDPAHRATLFDAARLAQHRGDAAALARAAVANQRGLFSAAGHVDWERTKVLEVALEAIGPQDSPYRARLLASLAAELGFAPDHEHRQQLSTEALRIARRLGDPATLGDVLARRWGVMSPTAPDERRGELAELSAVADRLRDPTLTFWATYWESWTDLLVGNMQRFADGLDKADRVARTLGQPFYRWMVGYVRSSQARILGNLAGAEASARDALELGEAAGVPDAFHIYGSNLFCIRYDQGRLDESLDLLRKAVAREHHNPVTPVSLALALCEVDRVDEARAVFDEAAKGDFGALPGNFMWLFALSLTAEVCARLGDKDRAAVLHARLAPHCGLVAHGGPVAAGAVDYYVALLATTLESRDEAETRFASAEAIHQRVGAPAWLARTRLEWARMLLTRRQQGDPERARKLLGQALATARELGLANVERRAVELL